jgi:hypothetical protein
VRLAGMSLRRSDEPSEGGGAAGVEKAHFSRAVCCVRQLSLVLPLTVSGHGL